MRNGTPRTRATERALAMLEAVVVDGGRSSIAALARVAGTPVATAHRQVATLVAKGYIAPAVRGRHLPGPRLVGLLNRIDTKAVIANMAAPLLECVADQLGTVVQFGTLDNDMVTYRIKAGAGAAGLFTKIGMQLEAYCSGIGKVLLAHLPDTEREAYLASGPFPALTANTITEPGKLRDALNRANEQGYAVDDGEIADGLFCVAVPLRINGDSVIAAISASFASPLSDGRLKTVVEALNAVVGEIEFATGFACDR